jgi:hypothetical protein
MTTAEEHFNAGTAAVSDEEHDAAVAAFTRAIDAATAAAPRFFVARAGALISTRAFAAALADAQAAIALDAKHKLGNFRAGIAAFHLDK